MNRYTMIILVLLRLAIGWHFLFEGIEKIRTIRIGPTENNKPFSSSGYFRESQGPLGNWMKSTVGDPIQDSYDLFAPAGGKPVNTGTATDHLSQAMKNYWNSQFNRFASHYHLDASQQEKGKGMLEKSLSQWNELISWNGIHELKDKYRGTIPEEEKKKWLIRETKVSFPKVESKVDQTLSQRIGNFISIYEEIRKNQPDRRWQFEKDVEKQRYLKLRGELEQVRGDLTKDLDEQVKIFTNQLTSLLSEDQKKLGPVPPPEPNKALQFLDLSTAYGLTFGGACLILGLLTRINCLFLAFFLLMTYLAVPPFPWLPVPPNTEGNYFYVNKNLIEMLALLALATTASGRWLGLDSILNPIVCRVTGCCRPKSSKNAEIAPKEGITSPAS